MGRAKGPESAPTDSIAPSGRVGGCLSRHWRQWSAIGAEPWVVSVLRDGYRIPFRDLPPPLAISPVQFPTYRPDSERALARLGEIKTMMAKGVLQIIPDPDPGFYSRLFLVEKSSGGWRPVTDLLLLNEFVRQTPFRMETPNSVLLAARKDDFLASIDLKDAYFQIPVHPSSVSFQTVRSTSSKPCVSGCRPPHKCSQGFSRWSRHGLTPEESTCYSTWTTG